MYPPVDYPLKASNDDDADAAEMTYAALLDRFDSEQPITNDMIQLACQKMDAAQQFPFAPIKNSSPVATSTITSNALLGRLKSFID